jgi:magnesium-transporting ATPase (P-type)
MGRSFVSTQLVKFRWRQQAEMAETCLIGAFAMKAKVYVCPFVAGPDPSESMRQQRASRLAFRICDLELCERIRSSNANDLQIKMLVHRLEAVDAGRLTAGDLVLIETGQFVHADSKVRMGAAMVDESAVTGQSGYVLRESGGDAAVMRDSLIVSGTIVVEVTPRLGHPLDWIREINSTAAPSGMATKRFGI